MEISKITDMNLLKSMAYDQIGVKERAIANLQMLNNRIGQLAREQEAQAAASAKKKAAEPKAPVEPPKE